MVASKFVVQQLMVGRLEREPERFRTALGITDTEMLAEKLAAGVSAIEREWMEHGSEEDKNNFKYVTGVARYRNSTPPKNRIKNHDGDDDDG
eukprot:671152-Rhodomonas_salina.6